jgi:iron-sulfur cluster repair protein YtfE (RIC family)
MPTAPDNVIELLIEDHRSVERRLGDFETAQPEARPELFWKLTDELVRHEVAEEVVIFPALREVPGGAAIARARIEEQAEAESQLARMEKLDAATPEFMAELTDLKAVVLEHAAREETEAFPLLSTNVASPDQVILADKYQAAKRAAPNHPHPHAPDTPPGNKILGPVAALVDRIRDAANGI